MNTEFTGAKIAVYIGDELAVLLRDDFPDLPFPDCWDFPGGGREGGEGPLECALRECHEELGLHIPESAVIWRHGFSDGGRDRWFFVAQLPPKAANDVVFGNEGQCWRLMSEDDFIAQDKAVTFLQEYLKSWVKHRPGQKDPPPVQAGGR